VNILLIGGTGNLSTDCAARLLQLGHRVLALTRGHQPVQDGCVPLVADRKDRAAMAAALKSENVDAAVNFLGFDVPDVELDHAVLAGRVAQYVFISSTTVYAIPHRNLPLTEQSPLGNPFWDYARKKQACEEWLMEKYRSDRFPVTIVRPSHTYSCHWMPNPISSGDYTLPARMAKGLPVFVPDQGATPWTLTASSDFAVGLCGLVGNPAAVGETFHITSDEALTWVEIYTETARAIGVEHPDIRRIPTEFICEVWPLMVSKLKGDKAEPGVFDNTKIKRFVPEFQCRKSFREGIAESAQWFRADPARQRVNAESDAMIDRVIGAWDERQRDA